jgi:hypothetical protein
MTGAKIRYATMRQGDYPTHIGYAPEPFRLLAVPAFTVDGFKVSILSGDVIIAF